MKIGHNIEERCPHFSAARTSANRCGSGVKIYGGAICGSGHQSCAPKEDKITPRWRYIEWEGKLPQERVIATINKKANTRPREAMTTTCRELDRPRHRHRTHQTHQKLERLRLSRAIGRITLRGRKKRSKHPTKRQFPKQMRSEKSMIAEMNRMRRKP